MANWKESAKQSLENRNNSTPAPHSLRSQTESKTTSGSWMDSAKTSLKTRGYVAPENRLYELKLNNGKNFGIVSYGAYRAVQNNKIDSYTPKNADERKALDDFKAYAAEVTKEAEAAEKQNRIDSNPIFQRYNIDPDNFTQDDFKKWAEEHGFEYRMGGNDLTGSEMKWLPKSDPNAPWYHFGFTVVPTKQEQEDKKVLEELAKNNQRKAFSQTDQGAARAAVVGLIDGLTFGAANAYADFNAKRNYKKAGLNPDDYVSIKQMDKTTLNQHKAANTSGDLIGSIISLGPLGEGVNAAAKGVKWIAKSPQWVQSAIKGGITFAISSGVETAFGGGNLKETLKNAGINFVGGAAGGTLNNAVASVGEKILFNKGLQHKIIPEMVRNGFSSAAFAGGKSASTYFLYPKEYRPDPGELAKDIGVALAFGTISAGINTIKASSQNKQYLDDLYQKMAADYESMAKANISSKNDISGIRKFAKNVIGYSNVMEAYLTGKEYNTIIDGNTYTFKPNKVRLVGKDEYVKSILSEIQTIRNNANAALNGMGTPSTDLSTTSSATASNSAAAEAVTTDLSSGKTASKPSVAVPHVVSVSASAPASVTPDTDIISTVAAAATDTHIPAMSDTADINTGSSNTPSTAAIDTGSYAAPYESSELDEIMNAEALKKFTPEIASNEIQRMENLLISQGADDISRKEIVSTALEIEKSLISTHKTLSSVFNNVSQITSGAVTAIKNNAGASNAYWKLFSENFKAIQSGNVINNAELISEYSNAYAEALKNNNPQKYNTAIASTDGVDIASELPRTIIQNTIPKNVQNTDEYKQTATQIKNIINDVDVQISSERTEIYGTDSETTVPDTESVVSDTENSAPNTEASPIKGNESVIQKNITFTQVGDFYEAYGDDAIELANQLNLTPTTKTVNGASVPVVGFPISSLDNYKNALGNGYTVSVADNPPSANVNEQNTPTAEDNKPINSDTTNDAADIPEGKILSLKHTKNIYALFKNSSKVVVGKDVITDGAVVIPLTDNSLAEVKKITGDLIQENPNISLSRFYHKDNDVVIQGNPKINTININGKKTDSYVFKINNRVYVCQQKYIDTFNNGKNIITANKSIFVPWSVHDEHGRLVALFIGARNDKSTAQYDSLPSVSDALEINRQKKAENASKPFNQNEVRMLAKSSHKPFYTNLNGRTYVSNGSVCVVCDDTALDFLKNESLKYNSYGIEKKEGFGTSIQSLLAGTELAEVKAPILYKTSEGTVNVCIVGDYAVAFNKNYVNLIKKRSAAMKIVSNGKMWGTLLIGYDAEGNVAGFALPVAAQGEVTTKDGKNIPFIGAKDIKRLVKEATSNVTKSDKTVTETPESVTEPTESVMTENNSVNAEIEKATIDSQMSDTDNGSQGSNSIDSSIRNAVKNDTPKLTDKCELIATKHTKTGDDLWVVTLKDKISSEDYKALSSKVKSVGGYYSRFAKTPDGKAIPGFIFKTEPAENVINTFNDFFDTAEETSPAADTKTETVEENASDSVLNNQPESDIIEENKNKDGVKNDESQSQVLAGESKLDGGRLHAGASDLDTESTTSTDDKSPRNRSGKILPESVRNDSDGSANGNASERVHRTDDSDSAKSETDGNSAEITDAASETIKTEIKTVEKKRPSNKGNFVITNDIATEFDNTLPSAKDNIEAIELLLTLENEGRAATAEEKKILAKYKGWGGIDTRYLPYELSSRFGKLFDYNQRRAMQSSQNNAFFTPTKVIDAMYNGLKRMGFKGGNVLETSMGVGNFFGRMPAAMSSKSALTGIELESYTARIAQYLYPGATVINSAFQDVAIKNGSYDLVIGNVPFGQNKISYNKKKYSLHNYFIISSLDKIRDGGIVAVITSSSTLESYSIDARSAIMDRADVVACYKLPEKVFSKNASTDVQTDLLILRKRMNGAKPSGDSILNVTTTIGGLRLNEYFVKHPENILGTLAKGTNAWGDITTVLNNGDFYDRLNTAMKKLPKGLISGKIDLKPIETIVSLSDKPRFFEKNGKVYSDDGAGTATQITKREQTVRDYMAVRDAYKELLDAYDRDLSEEEIKPLRGVLSKAYDNFYKNHTAITGDGKKKIGKNKCKNNTFLEADADYYLVSGLESYDAKNNKFVKSALFEKDTLRKKRVTSVNTASDALAVSLNESGKIDFTRMQELTGKTEKQLTEELKGEIVFTPDGDYVLTDIYLSGNIYEKLEAVKGKPEFKEQQEMLEKVIPPLKDASSIAVKLGANYINESYVEQFARETFNTSLAIKKDISGRWIIEGVRQSRYGDIVNVKYGCDAFNAVQLLEKILNDAEITATKKVGVGNNAVTVFDAEMTDIAKQKADDIRAAFDSWVFSDSERRTDIVNRYNRTYNSYRPLDYGRIAEKLSFDSMNRTLKEKLYPHQKKGIARFLFGGNILFAHGVGTGKTFEMIASVMEAKRMGIINKAAMVVPNNKLVDFKNDISQAYPDAKVLVIDTANKKRQTMLGLVNSNDWDIVLIARTTFTKIPVSRELQAQYTAQQLEDLEMQIAMAESDKSVSKRQLKGLITQRDNFEQKLKDLNSETKRDENSVDFEKLGIDCICVDEAHNYKSIMTPTKLNIKGLANKNNAQIANDMLMKLDYLRSIDGKIIFGTGTPITNTVSEIYNMMRMVRPDILENAGIRSLDEWVNTFAKIDTTTEIGIDNQIKTKSTQIIRSFINTSEMIGMFRQFADIVFTEDVVKNLPTAIYKDIEIEGTDEHRQIEKQISETIAKTKKSDLLKVYGQLMSMADAASVDLRMLSGAESEYNIFKDYSADELEYTNSKINTMCDIVFDKYKQSSDINGTQIIFCDKGSGSGTVYSFNLHKDIMQKLIDRGIPQDQVVIIKNQSDAQLEALYDKVNAGEVRVLIGTSQKMAEGLNVQKRVVAIYHPTVTYKPSDWEQGNARGVRAGNINSEVEIYRFLQKNTFDSHKWQAQDRKGEMINKALRGEMVAEMEDIGADDNGGASVDAATAMAITSGNPLVKEKIDIDKEVVRLKTLKRNYMSEVYRYQDAIAKNPGLIRQNTAYVENLKQDITLKNKYGDKASIVIKGKTFEKQTDANKALSEAVKSAPKNGQYTKLGTYNGFDIMFKGDTGGMNYSLILKGSNEYSVEYAGSGNNIARFAGVLNRLDAELKRVQAKIETLQTDLAFAKKEVSKPFEKENDLTEALAKQKDITYRYEHYGEKNNATESTETTETENTDTVHSSRDIADNDSVSRWTTERIEGSKDSKVNIADIVKEIRDKFGIPVSTGKVTDREASGIYKDRAETIRTRIANNLPTISHELGHHFDKKYNLSTANSIKELRNAVSEEFLNNYPAQEKNSEAVAEFVRIYLKNTNDANRLCPDFYSDFISTVSKEDLKALNEIASSVNEYLSYNISERYDAAIVSSQKKEKLPFRDRWHKWYSDWIDAFHPQKEAVDYVEDVTGRTLSGKDNAYVLATNSLNAHTVANFLVCEGFRDLDGNVINAKSFIDSIAMVNSNNVKLLDKYLVLKHSLEWIAPEQEDVTAKRVFADDTLENVEEIKKQIAELEKEHPEIKTAAENLYEYQNNVLKHFVIPAGGMTEETLADLNRKYPSYVPFYRAVGKKSGMAKGTFANQRSPIMRAKGSGALIISPTESIIRNTEKMVKFAMRNQVMNMWANYADTVDGFGQFMEKVAPDMIPHFTDISQQKGRFEDALQQVVNSGDDYFAVSDLFDEIFGDAVADFTPVANANKKIVTVLRDGAPSYYQIHDEAFYNSVAELSPKQTTGLLRVMNAVMQPMKLLITQNNPIFAATNALRDYGTAYKLSEINNPVTFAAQYVKALGGIISNSESYKQYKAMGGGHSSELSANIENISKTLRKVAQKDMGKARRIAYSIFRHPVETVATINDAVESVPRFMEFQRTLKADGDLQSAIFNADDITTNFKRSGKGDTAKAINKTIMFNNAAIQGVDKMFRTLTVKDPKKRYKTLLKWLLNALIMGVLGYLYNKEVDEEGYKNLSSYKKNNFYNYAIGDGKFISIPKPRENALLDTFTERTIEYVFGDNEDAFYDFSGYLGSQLLPPMLPDSINPVDAVHSALGSTIAGGLVDVGFNKDFKNAPIESKYDEYLPSNERYTESTTKLAYGLGQTELARNLDMSPKKIDHLISSYTGILGQVNKALFPVNENRRDTSIGLRNKFISDSNYSTDVLNKMYENKEKAEKAFTYSSTIDKAVEYEQNAVITSYISGMNKAVKALPEDEQRSGRAYLLKSLNSWDYGNTASQNTMLSRLDGEIITDDCIITSVPASTLEWTKDKVKYSYQMTPQEYNEYVKDYLALVEKYRTYQSNNKKTITDYTSALEATNTEVKKVLSKKYKQKYINKALKTSKK